MTYTFDILGEMTFFTYFIQLPLEFGTILTMDRFVLLEEPLSTRVWWRFTVMESGELCVLLDSIKQLQTPYVDNLDTVQLPSPALVTGNVIIILYMYALCGVPQLLGQFVKCSCLCSV